jgi:hypothetical protein
LGARVFQQLPMNAQHLLPSPADVEFYDDHGWWISPKIFSDEQIDEALEGARRYYAGQRDSELPAPIKRYLGWAPDQADRRLAKDDYVVLQSRVLREIGLAPVIGAIAGRLARTDEIRLFSSSLIHKPSLVSGDAAKVGWHVDRAYWQTCTSEKMLTAWIPLHDCDAEMGTITMIDRSHRWPSSPAVDALRAGTTFISDDGAAVERRLEELGFAIEWVPMSLEQGQVSFHSCRTFHGSDVNRSRAARVCLTVHLQDEENAYRDAQKPNGEPVVHNTDLLVRRLPTGQPDYRDPRCTRATPMTSPASPASTL